MMNKLTPGAMMMIAAASPFHVPYVAPGPYSHARGQGCKNNRTARPDKKAKRKRAAKSRRKNR